MRLLKTDTIDLLPQLERQPHKYAILSHTWGKDEVIFEDLVNGNPESKPAYDKVKFACRRALADNYSCIWIDNCCIDKSSSAELSEAINSMYVWYEQADICYAYLADVDANTGTDIQSAEFKSRFARSKWFKRGWTLQELLAPGEVIFFAKDWTVIGKKSDLRGVLSSITGIDEDILEDPQKLHFASIAKRMSWAVDRETTRPEDLAYCLMGIFSVNMPMLYGEGGVKAYLRLQEEIMKQSDDQSLFAWTLNGAPDSNKHGLLADSPSAFRSSHKIMPYEDYEPHRPFQMTNRGLSIELPLSRLSDDTWVAALDCPVPQRIPTLVSWPYICKSCQ
ncbi:heterokaryon incompatibility protein-domain-containing protein [Tricladium varicosporioides]|nr:heterokaryon incompatibility protein-domain-containing protein [Hymenoscyphus varicosporioides]